MNTIKKNILLIGFFTILLMSCNLGNNKPTDEFKKQWVYVELVTTSKTDTSEYFYFGQMNKSLVDDIEANKEKSGLFMLSNIRYWNNNDLLQLYEDERLEGDLIFKLEDIEEVVLYKDDPINLFSIDQLDKSIKKLRKKNIKLQEENE